MAAVICIVLGCLCLWLWLQVYTARRGLRGAARQLRELEETGSRVRLRLDAPSAPAEELLDAINALLDLRQQEQAAYRARERDLRRQISNVSHDLRTPLTSILGYLQLLEGEGLSEAERREYLEIVRRRAKALQSLITGFYDLSRLEGGEYPLNIQGVDLRASLSGLLAAFYDEFTGRGFEMEVDLQEGLPPVSADPGAALRIFTNLIRNALEHGCERMQVRLFEEEGRVVSLFANRTGELRQEDMPHIFDRFFTRDKMRTGNNTGLGLAIVHALAGQMGCTLSARLEGDWFSLRLAWPRYEGLT